MSYPVFYQDLKYICLLWTKVTSLYFVMIGTMFYGHYVKKLMQKSFTFIFLGKKNILYGL